MDNYSVWIIAGVILAIAEIFLPGGIVFFLGAAALIVGVGIYLGLINSAVVAIMVWFILSILLLLFMRSYFVKYFEGDSSIQDVDEENEHRGAIVEVVEDIFPYMEGRIKYRDTTWIARSNDELKTGQKAVITGRDGLCYIVKNTYRRYICLLF